MAEIEDLGCRSMANRAMDVLVNCNPKAASHCEKANMEKNLLEQMRTETEEMLVKCKWLFLSVSFPAIPF